MQPSNDFRRRFGSLSEQDRQLLAQEYRRRQLSRRLRRVARIAIVATRTNATARGRAWLARKRQAFHYAHIARVNSYRIAAVSFLLLFGVSTVLTPLLEANKTQPLNLDAATLGLIGDSRDDTKQYLSYDTKKNTYKFAVPKDENTPDNSKHTGRNLGAYDVSLPDKASDGLTVTENKTNIAMTLIPDFFTTPARKSSGDHIGYQSGARQIIYTLKYNGLKEDIIVPKYQGPAMSYTFTLRLPAGVEARMDDQGNIGIYSADPNLFGNVSYGGDEERATLEKARENSAKNYLVTNIPFPIVKEADGTEHTELANFSLGNKQAKKMNAADLPADAPKQLTTINEYKLTLNAYNLGALQYPISLDPTIQVTSSADFSKLNQENTTVDTTNNLIKRTSLTGGLLGSWTSIGNFDTNNATRSQAVIGRAPDGSNYIYVIGDRTTDIRYTKINTDGSLAGWASMPVAYPEAIAQASVMSYNGYVYVAGGNLTTNGELDHVYMGKIQANGIISTWSPTSPLDQAVYMAGNFAYNNRLYLIAGYVSQEVSIVQFANINADGTLSSWARTTSIPAGRSNAYATSYNGWAYLVGGDSGPNAPVNTVYGGKINDDGTISSWQTLTSMSTNRAAVFAGIYGGYIYAVGGCSAQSAFSCSTFQSSTEYAEVYANGTIGTWRSTTAFTTARAHAMGVMSNNFIYLIGGCSALDNFLNENCGTVQQTVQSVQVKPAGETGASAAQANTFASPRFLHATALWRNYIYISGGCTSSGCLIPASDVQYAQIASDGTIGTWTSATTFSTGRYGHAMFTWQSKLYITGGHSATSDLNDSQYVGINGNGGLDPNFTTDTGTSYTARTYFAFAQSSNRIYVIGGLSGSTNLNDVWFSNVKSAGDLLNWVQDTSSSFSNARRELSAITSGNYIYLVNGSDGTNVFNNVQYAQINSDNSLGTWTSTNNFGVSTYGSKVAIIKGNMYLLPGCTGGGCGGYSTGIRYKKINSDGTLSSTTNTVTGTFNISRMYYGVVTYADYLILAGGCSGSIGGGTSCNGIQGDTQFASVYNGGLGTLSTWTDDTALSTPRAEQASAVYEGYLYVLGGCTSYSSLVCSRTNSIEYSKISSNGSLSTPPGCGSTWCTSTVSLPENREGLKATAMNGYLYITGGETDTGATGSVRYTAINTNDGTLNATWQTAPSLLTPRWHHALVAGNGFLYVNGGRDSTNVFNDTEFASISKDGTVGNWTVTGGSSLVQTWGHSGFVSNGKLYVSFASQSLTDEVQRGSGFQYISIAADGSLTGSWTGNLRNPWLFPRSPRIWYLNGYVYYTNEFSSGFAFSAIAASNDLSQWSLTNGQPSVSVSLGGTAAWQGNLYSVGGCTAYGAASGPDFFKCSTVTGNVSRAFQQATPHTAQITKVYDFDTGVQPTKLITRGTKKSGSQTRISYMSSANTSNIFDTYKTTPNSEYNGSNSYTISLGTNRTLSRYLLLRYTIDDTDAAVFPDENNESNITDFDLYFIANPGSRLRGGRTFTNGVDRGLDAQPQ